MDKWTKVTTVSVMLMIMVAVSMMSLPVAAQDVAAVPTNAELRQGIEDAQQKGNLQAALKLSRQLEASDVHDGDWGYNAKLMANLLYLTKSAEAKFEYIRSAFEDAVKLEGAAVTHRKQMLASACFDYWSGDSWSAKMVETSVAYLGADEQNIDFLFRAYFGQKKYEDALNVLDKHAAALSKAQALQWRLDALVALKRTDAIPDVALEYVKVSTNPVQAANALQYLLPGDDVALCVGLTAQQVLDARKTELRRSTGRLAPDVLVTLANQLTKGGDARPLRVSDEAKALADTLDSTPLAGYFQPLLRGDHKAAFRYAYAKAKAAEIDGEYVWWINAAAGVIRCADQCYNGRALTFIQYINGTSDTNPAADMGEVSK